ncbi:hypothetical protein BS78_01G306300 [Paspalum vaginatum]|nr:hypothetical protein BS78_01G306300 [Paspalum vaginatum]
MAGGEGELKLLGTWASPWAGIVRIALHLKGLSYDYVEEDLENKSDLLLASNPVHKKVPVLIHDGKPVCESLVIVQYIDEAFQGNGGSSLLPADPHQRAIARFWAAYIVDKLVVSWVQAFKAKTEEERLEGTKQMAVVVETLEGALGDGECSKGKPFFGGDSVGYLDVVLGGLLSWLHGTQALCGAEFFDADKAPLLSAWAERFGALDAAKAVLPDVGRLVEFAKVRRAQQAAAAAEAAAAAAEKK